MWQTIRGAVLIGIVWSAQVAAADGPSPIGSLLGAADAARGEAVFLTCSACHTAEKDAGARIGPNLWNVIGREVANVEGFDYSAALAALEGRWDESRLNHYLYDPASYAPGTKMVFPGIRDDGQRADLIAYLRTLNDSPPAPAAGGEAGNSSASQASDPFGSNWPQGSGREITGYACSACHSLAIVKQQGLSRERWDELLEWMVEEQGMTVLNTEHRGLVLDFLAEHFNENRGG